MYNVCLVYNNAQIQESLFSYFKTSKKKTINVHNIYILCKNNKNKSNLLLLRATLAKKVDNKYIVIRDFNLY